MSAFAELGGVGKRGALSVGNFQVKFIVVFLARLSLD